MSKQAPQNLPRLRNEWVSSNQCLCVGVGVMAVAQSHASSWWSITSECEKDPPHASSPTFGAIRVFVDLYLEVCVSHIFFNSTKWRCAVIFVSDKYIFTACPNVC